MTLAFTAMLCLPTASHRAARWRRPARRLVSSLTAASVATPAMVLMMLQTACTRSGTMRDAKRDAKRTANAGSRAPSSSSSSSSSTPASSSPGASESSMMDWQSLFDGSTTQGWHGFKTPGRMPAGWQALDGALVRVAQAEDIVTDRTFANFELQLEWQISAGGNSGIIYRIDPTADVTYESGPEMQVLDDGGHADGMSPLTSAGAVYGLYPAPAGTSKPVGSWNAVRLLVDGNHVEHWLNGMRVASYELGSREWLAKVNDSKFKAWPGYGRAARGYIGLQEHGARVAYRNIRIRELP